MINDDEKMKSILKICDFELIGEASYGKDKKITITSNFTDEIKIDVDTKLNQKNISKVFQLGDKRDMSALLILFEGGEGKLSSQIKKLAKIIEAVEDNKY